MQMRFLRSDERCGDLVAMQMRFLRSDDRCCSMHGSATVTEHLAAEAALQPAQSYSVHVWQQSFDWSFAANPLARKEQR